MSMTRNEIRERKDALRCEIECKRLEAMRIEAEPADDGPMAAQERKVAVRKLRLEMSQLRNQIAAIGRTKDAPETTEPDAPPKQV